MDSYFDLGLGGTVVVAVVCVFLWPLLFAEITFFVMVRNQAPAIAVYAAFTLPVFLFLARKLYRKYEKERARDEDRWAIVCFLRAYFAALPWAAGGVLLWSAALMALGRLWGG